MPDMVRLDPAEWRTLRHLRLSALADSPDCFLSSYSKEAELTAEQWSAEFVRGEWHACIIEGAPTGLIGVTHEPDRPFERFIEYLWVAPSHRRSGIASTMLATVLDQLRTEGIRAALLWILNGNDPARHLYEKAGFTRTSIIQPIASRPGRTEHQMRRILA